VNRRSAPWARAFTPNCPGKKQVSGFGVLAIAVTKTNKDMLARDSAIELLSCEFSDKIPS